MRCGSGEGGGGVGGGTVSDIAPTVITARFDMGAAAVPSASSLENMAGILIALLILLIAAFHDTQKVQ